ncbi:MAG TPA: alpha/beta hydrolase [Pseudonocardiaceae bacterium]|nr:alpha/beta hydrolase [Pseudonocardiaceae bacterium]
MADASLGTTNTVRLPSGEISYAERGSGPPIVFVHGLLVNANLWRKIVPPLADAGFRCIAPDWPLGAHQVPMPADADLSPPGVAALIAEFLDALDLENVTIVANDTGGAITQILMANHPGRLGRVVLTPCDAFEDFLPQPFTSMPTMVRWLPGAVWLLSRLLRLPAVQRQPFAFGWLAKRGIPAEIVDSYLRPAHDSRLIRRDTTRFVAGVSNKYTLAAAESLGSFGKPVLLVRAGDDKIFSPRLSDRLAEVLPDARLVTVADSYTFVSEDQPAELARLVVEFAG